MNTLSFSQRNRKMDKISFIREKISELQNGLMDAQGNFGFPEHEGAYHVLCELESYIDSLGDDPVSEIDFEKELYKDFGQVKDFTLGMRIAKRFYEKGLKAGANLQKKQMMKDAVDGCIVNSATIVPHEVHLKAMSASLDESDYHCGDMVKLIIIKK